MHNKQLYLLGASGHAKVIMDILQASGKTVEGLFDDNPNITALMGVGVLGPIINVKEFSQEDFIISIGNNRIRKMIAENHLLTYSKAIHPSAILSPSSCVEDGTVVMAGTIVNASSSIGKHVILNTRCSIDHDCVINDFAHISPGATLAGNVTIGEGTHIGTGASVIPGIKIGKWAIVGAGAVIINDIPDDAVVVGNPGRITRIQEK